MLVKDYIPLILVDTENLPRDEWLEWRRKGIGGSDAATIIGVSPFSTARDLYYDKLNIVSAVDEENNWVQKEIGHLLEDLVHRCCRLKISRLAPQFAGRGRDRSDAI